MGMFERKIVNLFSFDFLFLKYLGFFFFFLHEYYVVRPSLTTFASLQFYFLISNEIYY